MGFDCIMSIKLQIFTYLQLYNGLDDHYRNQGLVNAIMASFKEIVVMLSVVGAVVVLGVSITTKPPP